MRSIAPAKPLADLLEKELEQQLIGTRTSPGIARMVGWNAYHTLRSRGSEPGYPDWTLVRERIVFIECKTERGRLSAEQKHWLRILADAGGEVYLIRPRHLDQIARVLSTRHLITNPTRNPEAAYDAAELRQELRKEIAP